MSRISPERFPSVSRHTHRGVAALSLLVAAALLTSCGKRQAASKPVPPKSVGKTLVASSSAFRAGMSIRIPREIAIEPRFGEGAAAAFAASLGRDVLGAEVLRSVSPSVAAMQDALVIRVNDSPISEQFASDAPMDMGARASSSLFSTPSYQRGRRYWRHYLRMEPVDPTAEEWASEPGDNEVDDTTTSARIVRTPGWKAMIAHRSVVAIDSMFWEGEALTISYRWRWVPSVIGAPFVSSDTLADDHMAANAADLPLLSSSDRRATLSFVKTEDGSWALRGTVATSATGTPAP